MSRREWGRLLLVPALALLLGGSAAPDYSNEHGTPDGIAILPPPPASGSAADDADRAVFRETRRLAGSARWRMAFDDVENSPLDRYACALGVRWTARQVPRLAALLDRIGTGAIVDPVKRHYRRARPFVGTASPICQPRTAHLSENPDYPSGHAANGWLEGLVLAELVPDRATAILARARAYGESRFLCGVHTRSAVEAGWMAGSVAFAALHGSSRFRRDLDGVRDEIAHAPRAGLAPNASECAANDRLVAEVPR